MIDAPPAPSRLRRRPANTAANQLQILSQQPQGAPQIDSQIYGQEVDSSHPLNLRIFLASDILKVNRVRCSFFVEAFRSPIAISSTTTSAGSSHSHTVANHSHTTPDHDHIIAQDAGVGASAVAEAMNFKNPTGGTIAVKIFTDIASPGDLHTWSAGGSATSGNGGAQTSSADSAHTHTVGVAYGIFEQASTLSGLQISVNGVDRTSALGGSWGTSQSELALDPAWFTLGGWNTVAVSAASGLGRVTGHLTTVSFVQSA
jgi:hypothetical protein